MRNQPRHVDGLRFDLGRGKARLWPDWRDFLSPVSSVFSVEPFYFLTLRMMAEKAVYNFRWIM